MTNEIRAFFSHYINANWVEAKSPKTTRLHDSSTEQLMATVLAGTAQEAAQAVLAARAEFEG